MTRTRAAALFWAAVTLALHSIPRSQLEQLPGGAAITTTTGADKVAHVALFGSLAFLWALAFRWRAGAVVAAGLGYGVVLEAYQGWLIAGRSASAGDVAADAAGLALGVALAAGLTAVTGRRAGCP